MRRTNMALVAITGLIIATGGCGSSDSGAGAPGTLKAELTDFKIALSSDTAPAGKVTFEVDNKGPSIHELVVVKTDLAPDALPTDSDGKVDEAGVEAVDELEDIGLGDSPKLEVELGAGRYVVVCNLPAHYAAGMATGFTVT